MTDTYRQYYETKLEGSKLFQDFVVDTAWSLLGLAIVQYSSRSYQQTVGESRTGVEIKFDEKFSSTGNLWIEVGEKARPRPGDYAVSGIYRDDNTWLYCIGNYDVMFFFAKTMLQGLHRSGKFRMLENHTKTSQGFLLKGELAEKYAAVVLRPNAAERVAGIVGDISRAGRALHEIAKAEAIRRDAA